LSEQAKGQYNLLSKRESIEKVLKKDEISKKTKSKLNLVLEVREFLKNDLGLKVKDNYTTYVNLERPWVVKALTVSYKCAIRAHTWSFPIVGKVPYLGFFNEKSALKEQELFKQKGFDTYLRGVSAYSTLGWFSDSVISTFVNYSDYNLISTIIHETVHMNIFKKGKMKFNENIAVFIEKEGTRLFIIKKYGKDSKIIKNYEKSLARSKERRIYFKKHVDDLKKLYKSNDNCSELLKTREIEFRKIENGYKKRFGRKIEVNNAYLVNFSVYNIKLDTFQKEFKEKFAGSLVDFIAHYRDL
jgi:predicted aminopeptidase